MNTIDYLILKEFSGLNEADKKSIIELTETMAAMTDEQAAAFKELTEKTILAIPPEDRNGAHNWFVNYAAEAIQEGATLPELLAEWQEGRQEGHCFYTEPRPEPTAEESRMKEAEIFTKMYHSNKTMEMICNCDNWFIAGNNEELADVINAFLNLPAPYNATYDVALRYCVQLLSALYNLGVIHGIRKERERRKEGGKANGTKEAEPAGT